MNGASAFFSARWLHGHPLARCIVIAAVLFVAAPLAGLLQRALSGNGEVWGHLFAFVLPVAVVDTALLLCGLAVVSGVVGVGTAFLVA
ncbi:MAG: binding-protein-dependent transport system inner rane component, partial [Hyphomicrobiales bacterium]|nr:binding-protein-dependent transport system inner rane component [Hyphomicrobiales bacterium]